MENAYDLGKYSPLIGQYISRDLILPSHWSVVLDDHEDFSKKVSEPLLDGILGTLDGFVVFQEGQVNTSLSLVNTDHVT